MTILGRHWGAVAVLAVMAWLAMAVLGLVMFPPAADAAEQLDITHCYSGKFSFFHDSKEVWSVSSWAQSGIIASNHENKILDNAVVHCEGVQRGVGEERKGYGLCKITDADGDLIIAEIPYTGFVYEVKFLEGSGKWEGIKGSLESRRTVRSKPGKGAMLGTYQGSRRERGTFD